jgi:cell shape-determining protein MreC
VIGQVTSIDEESAYRSVNVHPIANLHNLDIVQVLTSGKGTRVSDLQSAAASLPPGQTSSTGGEAFASTEAGGG